MNTIYAGSVYEGIDGDAVDERALYLIGDDDKALAKLLNKVAFEGEIMDGGIVEDFEVMIVDQPNKEEYLIAEGFLLIKF